ncbi:uncharacterized protein LOC142766949 [Rhipicephalus microplus]|uniref:uncharacterized protein LOC142766949 n=1 Tax=Rhipicephalus microplus TaxID=6941 RepID=UPI003F6BD092
MKAVLVGFSFISMMSSVLASCSEEEVPRFCQNYQVVPQRYCPNVNQNFWRCKPGSNGRCACPPHLLRAVNRKCVKVEDCDKVDKKKVRQKTQSTESELPMEVVQSLLGNPEDEPNVRKFIQAEKELHLLEISPNEWAKSECLCLDSERVEKTEHGAKRKVGCYVKARSITLREGQEVE